MTERGEASTSAPLQTQRQDGVSGYHRSHQAGGGRMQKGWDQDPSHIPVHYARDKESSAVTKTKPS